MKNILTDIHDKIMLRKRGIIETINDMLIKHSTDCAYPSQKFLQLHR